MAAVAGRQHGVVSYEQLLRAGVSSSTVSRWVRVGRLHRLYRGVYAVGHTDLSDEGRILAAVLACGDGAVASHGSAAYLWGLSPTCPSLVHVTIPGTAGRARRKGVVLHRSTTLSLAETTLRHNIPVTKPDRTRRDLGWDGGPTKSDLERGFLRICRKHGIPQPEVNARVGPYRPDFLWRDVRLIVEVDGYRYHSDRSTFRRDRQRDRYFQRRGFRVFRFADEDLHEPAAVAAMLAQSGQE